MSIEYELVCNDPTFCESTLPCHECEHTHTELSVTLWLAEMKQLTDKYLELYNAGDDEATNTFVVGTDSESGAWTKMLTLHVKICQALGKCDSEDDPDDVNIITSAVDLADELLAQMHEWDAEYQFICWERQKQETT